MDDHEVIAQQVSTLGDRVSALERRMDEVEKVNARMEEAALSTARALAEISDHWDQVYEAIRRRNVSQKAPE
jgi:outer membrane murein-binding lipoprotein Lpp